MRIARRRFLASAALAALHGLAAPAHAGSRRATPWRNWSGALVAHPAARFSPASEDELAGFMARGGGPLRPVGSGHSFAPLVPTDGQLIVLDQLTGLLSSDPGRLRATLGAGTRLADTGPALHQAGQALFNLPDIDRQTLAGATATATHGTGVELRCLSAYVTALRLVTPDGRILDLDAEREPALFAAARVGLGALGVVTRMTLQNRAPYRLKSRNWVARTEDVLAEFDARAAAHRHFEMFPLTHSDYALVLATDETDEPVRNPPTTPEEDAAFDDLMRAWMAVPPGERQPLIDAVARQIEPTEAVDQSWRILANVRNFRFNEMEYSVPRDAGAPCLREILATIRDRAIDVVFPLEYRYVAGDDTWLGMSSGDEAHCAISVHQAATHDFHPYFDLIEPIFWKYGGRPHWGKVHSLGHDQLATLYPRFRDFLDVRAALDPHGRMLNPHLRRLFGLAPRAGGSA